MKTLSVPSRLGAPTIPTHCLTTQPTAPITPSPPHQPSTDKSDDTRRGERLWILDARCRGDDPARYDPVNRNSAATARKTCLACPVRRECLLEALRDEAKTTYGPWLIRGGFTPKERRELDALERADLIADLADSLARTTEGRE